MLKLSLRDLFAVVTIVALALGWWVDRSRLAAKADHWETQAMDAMNWVHDYCDDFVIGMDEQGNFVGARIPPDVDQPSHSK